MKDEASYTCDACIEEVVIPLDLSAGESQKYVEDSRWVADKYRPRLVGGKQ